MIKREWKDNPKLFIDHLKKLIEIEEAEEIEEFRKSFLEKTPAEREKMGKALLRLKMVEAHYSAGGHRLVTLKYASGKPLPLYSPDAGDLVSLADETREIFETVIGTVYDKNREAITVALNGELPEWVYEGGIYNLNLAGSRSTYKKIYDTLKKVKEAKDDRLSFFRDLSLGLRKAESYDFPVDGKIQFFNPALNEWQKLAAAKAVAAKDISIIHGPPGTGKTTVLVEIIQQCIAQGLFVFATAPSNTACDQLLESLVKAGVKPIRLGHPARILGHLRQHTLDFQLSNHPLAAEVDEMEGQLERLFKKKGRAREFSNSSKEAQRDEIHQLKDAIRELEKTIFAQVLDSAAVVVGTHASATDPILKKKELNVVVMDEASQAIEPLAWIPLLRAEKVILSGDHLQLPPTVKSKEAENLGLAKTLFERFHSVLGETSKTLLRVQYRMHEKIMKFSSQEFYDNQLLADESVSRRILADLPGVERNAATEEVFVFIDTAGRGFEEKVEAGSESRYNEEEARLLLEKLGELLSAGVPPEQIAVISPYSAQVRLLNSRLNNHLIEVDSVDGFQGREKEAVLVSLVRANFEGEMGFLADTRRMNVAMTRAKRKLVVIGDSSTLSNLKFYEDLLKYAESIGAYRTTWEE